MRVGAVDGARARLAPAVPVPVMVPVRWRGAAVAARAKPKPIPIAEAIAEGARATGAGTVDGARPIWCAWVLCVDMLRRVSEGRKWLALMWEWEWECVLVGEETRVEGGDWDEARESGGAEAEVEVGAGADVFGRGRAWPSVAFCVWTFCAEMGSGGGVSMGAGAGRGKACGPVCGRDAGESAMG